MDIAERKRAVRTRIRGRIASVEPELALRAGEAIAAHVVRAPEFRSAASVALFAALSDEPATRPIYEATRQSGKQALLPRVLSGGVLAFFSVDRWEELVAGRYGVLEPPASAGRVGIGSSELALVPGVAFDCDGHRLGRGRGYYDRAIGSCVGRGPVVFGLCFALQVIDRVPVGPLDRNVDAIVTESAFIRAPRILGSAQQTKRARGRGSKQ
jgi:5-formyltetrahydrofolate cyclo-ligase